jgi:type I restriction enzyme M protein
MNTAYSKGQNKFCKLKNLRNESDVEQFFVAPLLADLGYGPDYLETKTAITQVSIGKGKKKKSYIPDYLAYAVRSRTKPVLIVDAKHPDESAEDGVDDAQLYASVIRRRMAQPKPEQYCIGVNGHRLIVKHYDSDDLLFSMSFNEFVDQNPAFIKLKQFLTREILGVLPTKEGKPTGFEFRSVSSVELPAMFEACHRAVWKAEKRSPASAFYEFAKVMFVKIDEDRRLREYLATNNIDTSSGFIPSDAVRFSTDWIDEMSATTDNPVDTILFAQLARGLEAQIAKKEKKRIFEEGEGIELAPSTIRDAVEFLEHLDLYAVDEDLNGRLFETFLTATMRGEALGQFFTPRSVVKFMVKLAKLRATTETMDSVLDGCCGSGGFLIEAMAEMSDVVADNKSLTSKEREDLLRRLKQETLWGIDAGKDPKMARIARLNMLLHKDGGSRIYFADALDKQLRAEAGLALSIRLECDELRGELIDKGMRFSCVLSNPPFSMTYERKKKNELAVLCDYTLALDEKGKPRSSLRSSVMFLERYLDLLTGGKSKLGLGRLITVMDESILNTLTSRQFREFILKHFIVKAVFSLPKNTFVKAQGSVKTSVLYLRKKSDESEQQPSIFMAICGNVGHSDSGKERPNLNELPRALEAFRYFEQHGKLALPPSSDAFLVSDVRTGNPTVRLDAQFFDPRYFATMGVLDHVASTKGWVSEPLSDLLREGRSAIAGGATPRGAIYPDEGPKFIRVQNVRPYRLEWNSEEDPCIDTRTHTTLLKRSQLSKDDLVLTITGTYGIAAVVPEGFVPANINQHSVRIQVNEKILPEYLCVFLNSDLCRPQFDRAVTGSSRFALDYPAIRKVRVLYPRDKDEQRRIATDIMERLGKASALREEANRVTEGLPKVLGSE